MAGDDGARDPKAEELTAIIAEIRERVRARHPESAGGLPLPDLMPLVHARDAAEAKVASIGTVNPRAPGAVNGLIQRCKRMVARALDWHVREQVEFNRAAMGCVEAMLNVLNEQNRLLAQIAPVRDIASRWSAWHTEWERKLSANEVQFLRSVADLQSAFQHRATLMEANFRDLVRSQHREFTVALEKTGLDIQSKLWSDMEKVRADYERMIHSELRVVRQRLAVRKPEAAAEEPVEPASPPGAPQFDYGRFAERFRGPEEYVRRNQKFYLPYFQGSGNVLDIGCGRGEFLEMMREAGVTAWGIDLSEESVELCQSKALEAEVADLFPYLEDRTGEGLGGIFCAQVVEHLPAARLPEMIKLCAGALGRGGRIAIETPNPECLAIFASHFYLDPTHTRPIPPALLVFYLEEFGFGQIEVRRLSPAVESMPALASLPEEFRNAFFGGLDYAVLARKL